MKRILAAIAASVLLVPILPLSAATVTSPLTATATVGTAFSYQITLSVAPSPGYSFSNVPAGLSGNSVTGVLSGTPTSAGTYSVGIGANVSGVFTSATLVLAVNAAGATTTPPPPPSGCVLPASAGETCGAGNPGPCVLLSCAPSPTANATITMFRAPGTSTTFAQLAAGLPPNCAYTDNAVTPGQTYSYYAETVLNNQSSGPSNTCAVAIPAAAVAIATPTVSVSFSSPIIDDATAVTATVAVSGTPAPTGSVTLTSGAFSAAAATLANGSVTIAIPANSLDAGSLSFTAAYTPDAASSSIYASAAGTGTLVVTPVAPGALTGTVAN